MPGLRLCIDLQDNIEQIITAPSQTKALKQFV